MQQVVNEDHLSSSMCCLRGGLDQDKIAQLTYELSSYSLGLLSTLFQYLSEWTKEHVYLLLLLYVRDQNLDQCMFACLSLNLGYIIYLTSV